MKAADAALAAPPAPPTVRPMHLLFQLMRAQGPGEYRTLLALYKTHSRLRHAWAALFPGKVRGTSKTLWDAAGAPTQRKHYYAAARFCAYVERAAERTGKPADEVVRALEGVRREVNGGLLAAHIASGGQPSEARILDAFAFAREFGARPPPDALLRHLEGVCKWPCDAATPHGRRA